MIRNKLIYDLPNLDYHGEEGVYSSSQLKTMLEDPELFFKKYITKEMVQESLPAFDIGTYFHTAILEPEKLGLECAVFTGGIRRGKEWEEFKANCGSRAIITKSEKETADILINAIKNSPICMGFLNNSKAEVSLFADLYVVEDEVYSTLADRIQILTSMGWVPTYEIDIDALKEFGTKISFKVRADALDIENGIISDLKSTTGNAKSVYEMQGKVGSYKYELSAAFYLDIFNLCPEKKVDFENFIWLFASKDVGNAKAYRATDKNIMVGRSKWKKAVVDLAYYLNNNWTFTDTLGEIGPTVYNLEWLERI